ncbi:unnamed protein product, partial [Closterium sp. NIES-53]
TGGGTGAGAAGVGGTAGAGGAGGATGAAGTRVAGGTAGARGPRAAKASGAAGAGGAGGAAGAAGVGGAGAAGAAGAGGAGAAGSALRRPFFYPQPQSSLPLPDSVLRQVLSLPSSNGLPLPLLCLPTDQSQPQLLPGSPLPTLGPHTEVTESLTERCEPETRASTPVCARCIARPRPPAVPGTHGMALRPSSVPQRVVLPEPHASSFLHDSDPESNLARAASPTLGVVASLVTESQSVRPPSVGGELALGSDVLEDRQFEFECLAATLPRFASMLHCPEGDPVALDIPTPRSYAEAIAGEYSSWWQTAMDAEMASWKSTGTYVDEVPPPGANIVDGMWIFRVKRPSGSPPAFKARYVARGFRQRQGVDFFQTFSPTPKMTTLRVMLHVAAQRDYELHSLDFSTAFLQGSLHEEIWLRRPPGFSGSFPAGTQWSLRRPVYALRQVPREWHDTLRTTLATFGFAPSSADPSLFLRTETTLPPFYVLVYVDDLAFATADTEALALVKAELQERHNCTDLGELRGYLGLQITRDRAWRTITLTQSHMVHQVLQRFAFQFSSPQPTPLSTGHSLSAPPSDESVEPSGPYPELVGCLMYLITCTRPDLAYPLSLLASYVAPVVLTGHSDASWADDQATQRSSQGYTFSLGSGSISWRSTFSSSVLSSSCEAEIYAGAMAAQELRRLTYLLTDLGERPRSPLALEYIFSPERRTRNAQGSNRLGSYQRDDGANLEMMRVASAHTNTVGDYGGDYNGGGNGGDYNGGDNGGDNYAGDSGDYNGGDSGNDYNGGDSGSHYNGGDNNGDYNDGDNGGDPNADGCPDAGDGGNGGAGDGGNGAGDCGNNGGGSGGSIHIAGILEEHDKARQEMGVPDLAWDDGVAATAQDWANKLASKVLETKDGVYED